MPTFDLLSILLEFVVSSFSCSVDPTPVFSLHSSCASFALFRDIHLMTLLLALALVLQFLLSFSFPLLLRRVLFYALLFDAKFRYCVYLCRRFKCTALWYVAKKMPTTAAGMIQMLINNEICCSAQQHLRFHGTS